MATTQKLLGEAVGIQFTGTRDETGTNPILGLNNGLIVGRFRRGRMDKPMRITQQNIRAELGCEPNNRFYQAVQAALDQFPFVWVLRVGGIDNGNVPIGCEGATASIYFNNIVGLWDIELDGTPYATDGVFIAPYIRSHFSDVLEANDNGWMEIINIDSVPHRIKLIPQNDPEIPNSFTAPTDNPTFTEHDDGSLTFCLKQASCLATSTSTSFPEHFTNVPDAVYYLSFTATENNVAATRTVSFNSDTQYIYTYTSIFNHLMEAAGYSYVGDPVEGWADVYSLLDLDVFNNILSGFDSTKINWANQSRPIDIQFIETPVNNLIGENGLQAIDLYPMLKTQNGNAPASLHSCGYGIIGSTMV